MNASLLLLLTLARADAPPAALEVAAQAELRRALDGLALPLQPRPSWVQIEVLDGDVATSRASFGALITDDHTPYRTLRAEVRVGDSALNSSNFSGGYSDRDGIQSRALPLEDIETALRREIWLALDEAYKGATEQYASKVAAITRTSGSRAPDFSPSEALVTGPLDPPRADAARVRKQVERLSGATSDLAGLEQVTAIARDWQGTRMLLSSEGTRAWLPTGFSVVVARAATRAPDGARLQDARMWVAKRSDLLPPLSELQAETRAMAEKLLAMRSAPVEEDYLGPVLFEQAAAVELFRQLLAAEIVGTPPVAAGGDGSSGEDPPTARLGRRLLPEGWHATDDPGSLPDSPGGYRWDFEGVEAERVSLIEDGIVRDLLMSRIPRSDLLRSNGHGRALGIDRRAAFPGVVRVDPRRELSPKRLERRALALARQAGLPYVLVVSRLVPPALSEDFEMALSGDGPLAGLTPATEAYRLYADGRREMVRGLRFVGVDRRVLRDIAAAGHVGPPEGVLDGPPDSTRFNIGAVGGLPVTWMVPPVLITELEIHGRGGGEARVLAAP